MSNCSTHHNSDWDVACMPLNHLTLLHIYTPPSTQHHLHYIVNTTPSTLHHHQRNIINTTASTHHHLHNTIYTTPSTQHHLHSTIYTTSSHTGRRSTWSTAILPLLPHSCWYPSCYSSLWFVLCSVALTYSTLGCPKTLLTCGVIRSYNTILSNTISFYLVLSFFLIFIVLFYLVLSYFILKKIFYIVLSCLLFFILFYLLFYLVLSDLILSCLILSI